MKKWPEIFFLTWYNLNFLALFSSLNHDLSLPNPKPLAKKILLTINSVVVWTILWRPLINLNSVNRSKTLTPLLTFRNFNLNNTILGLQLRDKAAMLVEQTIQYATCTSPTMHLISPPTFCVAFVFHPKRNWKQCLCKILGGNKVHYGRRASGIFFFRRICIKKEFCSQRRDTP